MKLIAKLIVFVSALLLHSASAGTRGYEKMTKCPTPPPAPADLQHCDFDYEALADEWTSRKHAWNNYNERTSINCYNMTVSRFCLCPEEYRGPFEVVVHDDAIVSPDFTRYDLKTMNELFDLVYEKCIESCPGDGAAFCSVQYAPEEQGSYITSLFINPSYQIMDNAISLSISSLDFCS